MKTKPILIRLPAELEKRGREIANGRSLPAVIVEALRAQWMPSFQEEKKLQREIDKTIGIVDAMLQSYPYGSIPAERKDA